MSYITLDDLNAWKREVTALEAARIAKSSLAYECGIPRVIVDRCHARQRGENWCWAAVVESVLRYYLVEHVPQEAIVARTFGPDLPDSPASPQEMAAALNGWHLQQNGGSVAIYARFFAGPPAPFVYLSQLRERRSPLILFREGAPYGHVLLATGLLIDGNETIRRIIVRDPAEDLERGRRPLRADENVIGFFMIEAAPAVELF